MTGRRFALLGLALAVALSGCGPQLPITNGTPSRELQGCAASGGSIQARGKLQTPMCVHRFADAGKACSSKSDCQGRCIADAGEATLAKGGPVAGHCQPDDKLFGCYAEVQGGKAKSTICVD